MKSIKVLTLILIVAIGFSMIHVEAEANRNKKSGDWKKQSGWWAERLAAALELTTEQKQEVEAIVAKYQVDRKGKSWRAESELMNKILTEDLDEATIRAEYQKLAAESEKLSEDRFVETAKMLSEIKAVLTEDQLKLWQEQKAGWFEGKGSRGYHKDKTYKKDGHYKKSETQ